MATKISSLFSIIMNKKTFRTGLANFFYHHFLFYFIFIVTYSVIVVNVYGATPFERLSPAGTDNASEIDDKIQNNNTALERLLSNFKRGARLEYSSASQLTVTAGEVCVSNGAGTDREFLQNTSSTTVTWSDLDTGAEANSTTYYVYAYGSSSADTFSVTISTNSSAPSGVTQYLKLGSFYNDASGNITLIKNVNISAVGSAVSRSAGTTYQADTDGFVVAYSAYERTYVLSGYSDSSTSPSTLLAMTREYPGSTSQGSIAFPVKAGDYYKTTYSSQDGGSAVMRWIPLEEN